MSSATTRPSQQLFGVEVERPATRPEPLLVDHGDLVVDPCADQQLLAPFVDRERRVADRALGEAGVAFDGIDQAVGDPTRDVTNRLVEFVGRPPNCGRPGHAAPPFWQCLERRGWFDEAVEFGMPPAPPSA